MAVACGRDALSGPVASLPARAVLRDPGDDAPAVDDAVKSRLDRYGFTRACADAAGRVNVAHEFCCPVRTEVCCSTALGGGRQNRPVVTRARAPRQVGWGCHRELEGVVQRSSGRGAWWQTLNTKCTPALGARARRDCFRGPRIILLASSRTVFLGRSDDILGGGHRLLYSAIVYSVLCHCMEAVRCGIRAPAAEARSARANLKFTGLTQNLGQL